MLIVYYQTNRIIRVIPTSKLQKVNNNNLLARKNAELAQIIYANNCIMCVNTANNKIKTIDHFSTVMTLVDWV